MKLSTGQLNTKALVEKRLGKPILQELIKPFFAKIDRGVEPGPEVDKQAFAEVLAAFKVIAWDFNCWVEDFRNFLLFPLDFIGADSATQELAFKAWKRAARMEDRPKLAYKVFQFSLGRNVVL